MSTCPHCHAWNLQDEQRCVRCGRRLESSALTDGALATDLAALAPSRPTLSPFGPPQGLLFEPAPGAKIIPFQKAVPPARPPAPRRQAPAARKADYLPLLDYLPPAPPGPRTLPTKVEAVIYCDAPVATLTHRVLAAALDGAMILIGFALFLSAFFYLGGEVAWNAWSLVGFTVAFASIALFYGLLWLLAGADTPGKQWTRLRLINFDGYSPEPAQRALRFLGVCLSFSAASLGLLWAMVDEETLAWHDHISKTFLTFREIDTNFYRR